MPSVYYAGNNRTLNFLNDRNGGTPPYFEGYTVAICDSADSNCLQSCFDMSSASTYVPNIKNSIILLSYAFICTCLLHIL